MPSFGRGGARSGSMIGRRNLPGTGRGFNGSCDDGSSSTRRGRPLRSATQDSIESIDSVDTPLDALAVIADAVPPAAFAVGDDVDDMTPAWRSRSGERAETQEETCSVDAVMDVPPPGYRIADTAPVAPPSQKKKKKKKKAKRRRPDDRRASSASDPVKRRRASEAPEASPRRPRRSCTESPWGDVPDYGCAAYDDRVDAAVRAGAVLFPKRSPW